jgi:hypothetical protein
MGWEKHDSSATLRWFRVNRSRGALQTFQSTQLGVIYGSATTLSGEGKLLSHAATSFLVAGK